MTHIVNYKDILAFKNTYSNTPISKDYNATIKKIFHKISDIKNDLENDTFVIISFDETVQFVDPLFFILLFDLYYEHHFTLVIDIRYMKDNPQHYIQRILTQYSDLDKFQTYSPYAKHDNSKDLYAIINSIAQSDHEERELRLKRYLQTSNSMHLFSSVAHKKSLINDREYEYSLLPILRLRNYTLKEIDTAIHEEALDPYKKRINFYNKLSLQRAQHNIEQYRTDLHSKIEELLIAVGLGNKGLSNSFRDIFFELIDNIRKHTSVETNAHISFRKDSVSDMYELIIGDNSNKGFLNTYRDTLKKEQSRLIKSGVKEKYLKNYQDIIEDIDEENYKKVLTGLFQIQKKNVKSSHNEDMHIHQIPRIAMHFGLPLLVKLLEKLSKQRGRNTPELKLFLHNENKYFEIIYSFNNGEFKLDVKENFSCKKNGTYIIVTFPKDVKITEKKNSSTLININFQNDEYKLFLDKKETIADHTSQFSFYLDKHIEKDIDIGSSHTYSCENGCAFIKYTGDSTFSEFIRNVYLYAYKYDIEDIVVFNVPLYKREDGSENIEHIKLLETIMYDDEEIQYEKTLNVLFYSDREPEAILIGGRNKEEYCYLNQFLPTWYEAPNYNTICTGKSNSLDELLSSKLFVELDAKTYMLPFELFEIPDTERRNSTDDDKVSILGNMLEKYLNEVAKKDNLHIDTGAGYHIDRFMEFKKVFEDSRWVKRLAFRLAMQFSKKIEDTKYYLYGTDKYTNMLISLCYTYLGLNDFDRFRYKLFNIYDSFDYKVLRQKIKKLKEEGTHEIHLVSSVVVNARKDIKLVDDFDIKAIPAIYLNIKGKKYLGSLLKKNITPLVSIENNGSINKITRKEYCKECLGQRTAPLLKFTENDPFFIKDTFFDTIHSKKIESYSNKENINVKWFDSINFGHIERGNNHFLYYINTIKFFNQNRDKIEFFLKNEVAKKINYNLKEKKENIVLLTSSHDTNNNFVAMVNQEVFYNDAIVLSFNKSRGEANFHDLELYASFGWENTRVFFVDDSIASSHTLKYFYQMLRSIPEIMKIPNVGLDGVIVMVDRISSYDETILCSYLKDVEDIDKSNEEVQQEKLKAIYAFATFDIKPIKSEVEACFLCDRNKRYMELAKKSALDLTTFQMVKRAYKLRKIEYRAIQPAKEKTQATRFKNYLKSMATIYIYKKFAKKEHNEFGEFDSFLHDFSENVFRNLLIDKGKRFGKYDAEVLSSIIVFQSEIALIKALSSPRLSYYYESRKWLISMLLKKLKVEIDKTINRDFELEYKLKDMIEDMPTDTFDPKDKEFINFYKKMTNLHLINIYLVTLGYFEDSKILDTDYIQFFYKITQNKDVRDFEGDSLLHTYPFAVKFTIADNLEKSIYFENNVDLFLSRNSIKILDRKKKYSYINVLKIENTLYWKNYTKENYSIDISAKVKDFQKEESVNKKIAVIQDIFNAIFKKYKVYLFVSPYASITPESYQSYLNNSEESLINILDSYKNIDGYEKDMIQMVQKVFYGAVDLSTNNEENIDLTKVESEDIISKITDTWANDYNDKYCVVRLTTIDEEIIKNYNNEENGITNNKPVWFRPIGCIVVEGDSMDYALHMEISRTILSIKNYITGSIEKGFSYGVIQEAINKEILKQELKEGYKDMLTKISHSVNEYINLERKILVYLEKDHTIKDYQDYLKNLIIYSWGLEQITSLSKIERDFKYGTDYKTNVSELFINTLGDTNFTEKLNGFIEVAGKFHNKLCPNCNIEFLITVNDDKFSMNIDGAHLKIIIFELIFNALGRIDTNGQSKIEIKIEKNGFIVINTLENILDDKGNRMDDKINNIDPNKGSSRMGIQTIKKALTFAGYKLIANYDKKTKEIKVSITEGKNE